MDRQVQVRIVAAVEAFGETRHGRIEKMQGRENQYRLRVGDWRVIFEPDGDNLRILNVGHRSHINR
ncbi:MAG: type II toxin-antitoxin system RelE/ParE family toxin [Candidatus Poribacteria bacterium]|nr:type II toxin-antitoxin system RelE/ParE family toxin [Candidatus Poribacteria bacterium]